MAMRLSPCDTSSSMLCGTLEVFEDNLRRRGRRIGLHVEVAPSTGGVEKADPVFILLGGPGQASTDLVSFFRGILAPVNRRSDLVFIDQRGTGRSNPLRLDARYEKLQDFLSDELVSGELLRRSYDSLSRRHRLDCYGTVNAIRDIEAVRRALGYRRINLYGTSYGTRVALAYMAKYPKRVRSATLKGVVPPDLVIPYTFAADAQRSMELLYDDCHDKFPHLEAQLRQVLDAAPLQVSHINPRTRQMEKASLSRGFLALNLRSLLMAPSTAATLPSLIGQAYRGNYEPLVSTLLTIKESYVKGIYDGMTLCVICGEDAPRLPEQAPQGLSATLMGSYWIDRVRNACGIWNPEGRGAVTLPPLRRSSIPVLFISGNRDPATPPANAERIMPFFPNSRHVVVPQGGHSFDRMRGCVDLVICDFMEKGAVEGLDAGCAEGIEWPEYK